MKPQEPAPGLRALAGRLRALRLDHWPDAHLTQAVLARALGGGGSLGASAISSWENAQSLRVPTPERLAAYATFFATRRSVSGRAPRLLGDSELSQEERSVRADLERELLSLRAVAVGEAEDPDGADRRGGGIWHFPDGEQIRLVCGEIPNEDRPRYAAMSESNYIELLSYADLDALVELFGHLRATNPSSDVRFRLARDIEADDLTGHVVLMGGAALNEATRWFYGLADLPVVQGSGDDEVFVMRKERTARFAPTFGRGELGLGLVEDVGLLARAPNPANAARTLTICGGVYTRGVYGAVRCFTDAQLRDNNETYIRDRFDVSDTFGLLMRVPVFLGATSTPDLTSPNNRLYEWPEKVT
jgi:hypothetical protein